MINCTSLKWFIIKNYSIKRMLLPLLLIFAIDILYIASKSELTEVDAITVLYYGCTSGNFVLTDLLFFLIFNFTPLYFSAITLDSKSINAGNTIIIRFRKKSEYYLNLQISFCFFLILYFFVHILAAIIYSVIFFESNIWFNDSSQILYGIVDRKLKFFILISAIVLRFIELLFTQKVLILLHSIFGNLSIEFISILFGYFLVPFVDGNLYPLGLSSIARIFSYEGSIVRYVITLAFIYVACSIIIDIYISKKKYTTYWRDKYEICN